MSFLSALYADVKFAATHPATVRKETVAAATSLVGDIAVFNSLTTNVPTSVQAVVSGVQAVAVFVLTLLNSNESKAAAVARKGK